MNTSSEFITLFKLGYLLCDVPEEIMEFSRKEAKRMISSDFKNRDSFRHGLAGVLNHEYRFTAPVKALNAFFKEIIPTYLKEFEDVKVIPNRLSSKDLFQIPESTNAEPSPVWINFQKKYEHNPLHVHTGHLSFVYWLQIPYNLEDEANLPHTRVEKPETQEPKCSKFSFHFPLAIQPSVAGIYNHNLLVDKTWEGKMIVFPSWLHHSVTPFYTSDDYRISVSGNLFKIN